MALNIVDQYCAAYGRSSASQALKLVVGVLTWHAHALESLLSCVLKLALVVGLPGPYA